jgi:hypothetical protein
VVFCGASGCPLDPILDQLYTGTSWNWTKPEVAS